MSPGVLQGASLFAETAARLRNMPKMKTHKSSLKRFRVSANGKLKRHQAGKKHLNSHKRAKRKRHLRSVVIDNTRLGPKYVKMMGQVK
jgi:large subunit ribosomal protein L35